MEERRGSEQTNVHNHSSPSLPLPLSLTDLHLDLGSRVFGGLQLLHQDVVSQEVALCSRQPGQQLILQDLQLNLKQVLLLGQITLSHRHTHTLEA